MPAHCTGVLRMSNVVEVNFLRGEALVNACLNQGGSGRGVSYYLKVAACPKRVLLNEQAAEEGEKQPLDKKMVVGLLFHKLAELYHTGQDVSAMPTIYEGDIFLSDCLATAWRL